MAKPDEEVYEELRKKYVEKLRESLSEEESSEVHTRQYEEFRSEYMPKPLSWYEDACNRAAKILPLAPDAKKRPVIERAIRTCHLQTTPEGITAFSILAPLSIIFISFVLFTLVPMAFGSSGSLFVTVYIAIIALILVIPLQKIPLILADNWRMRASNQMVLCIFYIVTYMRHTSNLELAIDFAAEHLSPPLSLDMKKIIWSLETEKYGSLKESLEVYLETWRGTNDEFIDSMHLIESSLVEGSETRRLEALDKSLNVMLEETYEKMLHYAHNLKSPLTTLHMLGIILPILGLVILPLLVSFMPEVRWYHLMLVYDITLPGIVYLIGRDILSKRPTGYGDASTQDEEVENVKVGSMRLTPFFVAAFVLGAFLLIGALPLLIHAADPSFDLVFKDEKGCSPCTIDVEDREQTANAKYWLLEYRDVMDSEGEPLGNFGPFGIIATLLSLAIPLGIGLSIGLYYKFGSKDVRKRRAEAKKLELEFASALFQLGNRLADGLPLELAFSRVAAVMPDTVSGRFFQQVSMNITKLGLSVDDAIFHEKYGAINQYPSSLVESSMKVLVESSRKGPLIASQAIINVSNYIKEMHRVDERLKDLMADVISSMTSQIKFLTPTIAGIVMGITSMITAILGKLGQQVGDMAGEAGGLEGVGGMGTSLMGGLGGGAVGTYWFQIVVGLYVVEIIFVLTILVNGIENGPDKTSERAMLGENMINSTITYVALSFVVILLFNVVAANII